MSATLTNEQDIIAWLHSHSITHFQFEDDSSVVVQQDVDLSEKNLEFIPVRFKHITGSFDISNNCLLSLTNSPQSVGGDFLCEYNTLSDLKGAPHTVRGNFDCSYNHLTTLEGGPQKVYESYECSHNLLRNLIGAPEAILIDFDCNFNRLVSLEGAPKTVARIFYCSNNYLENLNGAPKKAGSIGANANPLKDLLSLATVFEKEFFFTYDPDIHPQSSTLKNGVIFLSPEGFSSFKEKSLLEQKLQVRPNTNTPATLLKI